LGSIATKRVETAQRETLAPFSVLTIANMPHNFR
jgi:hypothetical protein